jgi:hypothetical protein
LFVKPFCHPESGIIISAFFSNYLFMRKYLLLPLLALMFLLNACSKTIEDRLTGKWKLTGAYKERLFNHDYFLTGYEGGVFTFLENGDASYISNTDTLNGTWSADNYSNYYYNNGSGKYETTSMRYLHIYLVNFTRNKFLNWEFDDFHFKNDWKKIKAQQFSLSNDRVYEFAVQ